MPAFCTVITLLLSVFSLLITAVYVNRTEQAEYEAFIRDYLSCLRPEQRTVTIMLNDRGQITIMPDHGCVIVPCMTNHYIKCLSVAGNVVVSLDQEPNEYGDGPDLYGNFYAANGPAEFASRGEYVTLQRPYFCRPFSLGTSMTSTELNSPQTTSAARTMNPMVSVQPLIHVKLLGILNKLNV
ncbi:YER188W-like protein [Saccharomyces kudriavzevii IFO 1802]|uniref:YER188W-like protein n=2 Tax=Saccharomyces kudriavzevii (strain ATCC MYA-4449 / AS 2.2408 / CBS 8840 / NBRC 1802 / NCYC 2889) TaxID=226230 RepID=J5P5D1_SACK1|nr:YER188W-like protein [Saccharomyces kudriavzevii IFO 1802]